MACLILGRGTPSERRFELEPGVNLIGRALENQVVVTDPSLSRSHARLELGDKQALLYDLASRNGTFLEGVRIASTRLRSGDVFRCGDVSFAFVDEDVVERGLSSGAKILDELIGPGEPTSALRLRTGTGEDRAQAKLQILLRVSQILSLPEPTDRLLEKVVDLLFLVFDVDRAALLLVDPATNDLLPVVTRSRRGAISGTIHSRRIVETVRQRSVGVLASDATTDPRFENAPSVLAQSIRSSMCAPLKAREAVLGVVYVDHLSKPSRYSEEDLDFLGGFSTQAAIAIENARLSRRLEEEAVRRSSLLRFFPPAVVKPLMEAEGFGNEPRDHLVTVLFSDISGFTAMSSTMPSREVVDLLNRYFPPMAEIVFRHEGTLEKYIGDALMAIWGAPLAHEDDADRALRAALEMLGAVGRFNEDQRARGREPIAIHVGLNSGPVTFGNIGSEQYVQYAAIGDTTNVASRVCCVAGAGEVVVSAATRALLRGEYAFEPLPPARVKGKEAPLELFRVRPGAPPPGEDGR